MIHYFLFFRKIYVDFHIYVPVRTCGPRKRIKIFPFMHQGRELKDTPLEIDCKVAIN